MFEDIPVDSRHMKATPMIARRPVKSFPLEWVDSAIQRELERAEKTGNPLADWVEGAKQSIKQRKDKQAERAVARHTAQKKDGGTEGQAHRHSDRKSDCIATAVS